LGDRIRQGLSQVPVVIVAGFQGMNLETKDITTLGRGGTDLTAIAITHALQAEKCEFYKDVPGISTADPKIIPHAKTIPNLTWNTMTWLSWSGSSVLHARATHLAQKFQIPLEIRSGIDLERIGTIVKESHSLESPMIAALSHKRKRSYAQLKFTNFDATGDILKYLWDKGDIPEICQNLRVDDRTTHINILWGSNHAPHCIKHVKELASQRKGQVDILKEVHDLATITVVGEGFWQAPELVHEILDLNRDRTVLFENKNTALMICVKENHLETSLQTIHRHVFE
jgi:aspartate kinase